MEISVGVAGSNDLRRGHVLPRVALRGSVRGLLLRVFQTATKDLLAGLHAVLPELRQSAYVMFGTICLTQCRLPRTDVQSVTLSVTLRRLLLSLRFSGGSALLGPFSNT